MKCVIKTLTHSFSGFKNLGTLFILHLSANISLKILIGLLQEIESKENNRTPDGYRPDDISGRNISAGAEPRGEKAYSKPAA